MTLLTVRDVAERIRRSDEDLGTVIDRLKNWTKEGLLDTDSEKNPGTGRKRRYPEAAIIDALVLNTLTQLGIPAVRASQYGTGTVLQLARYAVDQAPKRCKRGEAVYLVITRGRERVAGEEIYVQFSKGRPPIPNNVESAIVLNISRLLQRVNWSHASPIGG
jgi:hypothetical protein